MGFVNIFKHNLESLKCMFISRDLLYVVKNEMNFLLSEKIPIKKCVDVENETCHVPVSNKSGIFSYY